MFIKLGGSLISDKTKPETLRGEVLDRIARCVCKTFADVSPTRVVPSKAGICIEQRACRTCGLHGANKSDRMLSETLVEYKLSRYGVWSKYNPALRPPPSH